MGWGLQEIRHKLPRAPPSGVESQKTCLTPPATSCDNDNTCAVLSPGALLGLVMQTDTPWGSTYQHARLPEGKQAFSVTPTARAQGATLAHSLAMVGAPTQIKASSASPGPALQASLPKDRSLLWALLSPDLSVTMSPPRPTGLLQQPSDRTKMSHQVRWFAHGLGPLQATQPGEATPGAGLSYSWSSQRWCWRHE